MQLQVSYLEHYATIFFPVFKIQTWKARWYKLQANKLWARDFSLFLPIKWFFFTIYRSCYILLSLKKECSFMMPWECPIILVGLVISHKRNLAETPELKFSITYLSKEGNQSGIEYLVYVRKVNFKAFGLFFLKERQLLCCRISPKFAKYFLKIQQ